MLVWQWDSKDVSPTACSLQNTYQSSRGKKASWGMTIRTDMYTDMYTQRHLHIHMFVDIYVSSSIYGIWEITSVFAPFRDDRPPGGWTEKAEEESQWLWGPVLICGSGVKSDAEPWWWAWAAWVRTKSGKSIHGGTLHQPEVIVLIRDANGNHQFWGHVIYQQQVSKG